MVNGGNLAERLKNFHSGTDYRTYEFFGCIKLFKGKFSFRVWAPHAVKVDLCLCADGERRLIPMQKCCDGESFEVETYAAVGNRYFYVITTADGRILEKADPYAFASDLKTFRSVVSQLPKKSDYTPKRHNGPMNVYEVNLLSWKRHPDNSYYSYLDLARELVPYVKEMGYTHVEFMPVTEFPFDGSWGYQVTGYFAVTSRMGTRVNSKCLIDAFHAEGIKSHSGLGTRALPERRLGLVRV